MLPVLIAVKIGKLALKMFNKSKDPEKQQKRKVSGASGPGYIILNILRVLNIISLLTVVVGSWIMLVRTVQTSSASHHRPTR